MPAPASPSLTDLAKSIWRAGVDAVASERLVESALSIAGNHLTVCDRRFEIDRLGRIIVVGGGKAGAGMATALESRLTDDLLSRTTGWVNVPEDCVRTLRKITLHGARPASVNEPAQAGVDGAERILELVRNLNSDDLCLVLLSGGGSALLPAPIEGVSLHDKQTVTRQLMHNGATIHELNCVRKQLSRIKGGGLARAAQCGTVMTLIISDVAGDPLDVIASGPTVEDSGTASEAISILQRLIPDPTEIPDSVWSALRRKASRRDQPTPIDTERIQNRILGNNRLAVDAAAARARELGFQVDTESETGGIAADFGRQLAVKCLSGRDSGQRQKRCVISGGEPTVKLTATDQQRQGGRNQELVLAAIDQMGDDDGHGIVLLSGGTDGEDGPTDAAGAWLDRNVLTEMRRRNLDPGSFLAINNSYPFFEQTGGLLITGPTHTNVMDLRVALIDPTDAATEL